MLLCFNAFMKSGFLLINKPIGPTSHDIVGQIRRLINERRVGHAGTLDPFAEGLLIIGVGREATKQLSHFLKLPKTYAATAILGATSDTDDLTGIITSKEILHQPSQDEIESVVKTFLGIQKQIPPMYSAKKVGGQKLYSLARKGISIERVANEIEIHEIKIISYAWPRLEFEVNCSSGTYIRTIAHDIGDKLNVGGYLEALKRTTIGPYNIKDSHSAERLRQLGWTQCLFSDTIDER